MNENDPSFAKKRLGRDLRVIVFVQVAALGIAWLGLFLYGGNVVPNYPEWDAIHLHCGVLALAGMITFVITAFWGFAKLMDIVFLPTIRIYLQGVLGFFCLFLLAFFFNDCLPILGILFGFVFPFYCVIPQFFIARWLTKEAENGTI